MDANIILLFMMMPALVPGRIIYNIIAKDAADSSSIRTYGSSEHGISDDEISSFRMTDSNLKNGVRLMLGKSPNDVFLRSPKRWNDLYSQYGWSEVTTKLEPVNSKIKDVSSYPVSVYKQRFVINSTIAGGYPVRLSQTLEQTAATTWNRNHQIDTDDEIFYSIGVGKEGKRFSFMSQWGKNEAASKTVTIGTPEGVQVTVNPGQEIIAELTALRSNVRIEIDHQAILNGSVVANFNPKYKPSNFPTSHHFFSLGVNDVMSSANLTHVFNSTETISVTFYSEAKLTVHDHATGSVLLEVPVEVVWPPKVIN